MDEYIAWFRNFENCRCQQKLFFAKMEVIKISLMLIHNVGGLASPIRQIRRVCRIERETGIQNIFVEARLSFYYLMLRTILLSNKFYR